MFLRPEERVEFRYLACAFCRQPHCAFMVHRKVEHPPHVRCPACKEDPRATEDTWFPLGKDGWDRATRDVRMGADG